jgi:hypothetical protein
MNGKGSRPRNNFSEKFRDNYDSIFKKKVNKTALKKWQDNIQLIDKPADALAKSMGMERYKLVGSDRVLLVHPKDKCKGQHCCIHNPSDHHMKEWPQNWRGDRGIMERMCPHGIGHPDPDDPNTKSLVGGVHGCDGCCTPPKK